MPRVIVLAGINGAGKTTASVDALSDERTGVFVNADIIARGLNLLNPESVALQAGQVMWDRINALAAARENFAIETTLSGRTYFAWLRKLKKEYGYETQLYYYWLRSAELAITRIAARVKSGGHYVPDATVRQRYQRSVSNFLNLYLPLFDQWDVYDNSNGKRILIATGNGHEYDVASEDEWKRFTDSAEVR